MGQAVTVANASGDRLYVRVQSSVQISEKTDFILSGSTPSTAVETTGKLDVEVIVLPVQPTELSLSSFKRPPAQDPHGCSSTIVCWLQLCFVHTVVRRCCDCCEFGADHRCPDSTQLSLFHLLLYLRTAFMECDSDPIQ